MTLLLSIYSLAAALRRLLASSGARRLLRGWLAEFSRLVWLPLLPAVALPLAGNSTLPAAGRTCRRSATQRAPPT